MRLSIGSYTYTWAVGVPGYPSPAKRLEGEDLVNIAADVGVTVCQLADNIPLSSYPSSKLHSLSSKAADLNVELEIGTRGTDRITLETYLNLAVSLKARLVRTVLTSHDENQFKLTVNILKDVLPRFEDAGVLLSIENHDRHPTLYLRRLIEECSSSCLGVCLDTVNSFAALEAPNDVVDALGPFTNCLHIKDFEIVRLDHQMGFIIQGTPAGKGRLNIPRTLQVVSKHQSNISVILELWTPYCGSLEQTILKEASWAKLSIDYLRSVMK